MSNISNNNINNIIHIIVLTIIFYLPFKNAINPKY